MKKLIYIVIVITFLFYSIPALAISLETKVKPKMLKMRQYETAVFNLEIKNNQNIKDSFLINVDGKHLEWKIPGDILLVVGPGEKKTTKISFHPLKTGRYEYTVVVRSFSFPDIISKRTIVLDVEPHSFIDDINLEMNGDMLTIDIVLISSERLFLPINFIIKNSKGNVLKSFFTRQFIKRGENNIKKIVYVGNLIAGDYILEIVSNDIRKMQSFVIEPIHKVVETRKVKHGFLYDEIIITVNNLGNTVENYKIAERVQKHLLTSFITKPKSCMVSETQRICEFEIKNIKPKTTSKIIYRIEYWPTYMQIFGIIAIISILGSVTYTEVTKPRIKKRHFDKKGSEHHIILEIKNPYKNVKNVIVRDFVSPLADVVYKFEHMKPIIKKSEAGTEIIWKIGHMKPKEERILNYRIKPLVEGILKMPKAYLRYKTKSGKRVRVYSKHLIINTEM